MPKTGQSGSRVFKTAWFARAARKARIADGELCAAIGEAMRGRLWFFEYLFAKRDRANIASDELAGFRALAKVYAGLTEAQIEQLLEEKDLAGICNGD